jgi:hypothetical protein
MQDEALFFRVEYTSEMKTTNTYGFISDPDSAEVIASAIKYVNDNNPPRFELIQVPLKCTVSRICQNMVVLLSLSERFCFFVL